MRTIFGDADDQDRFDLERRLDRDDEREPGLRPRRPLTRRFAGVVQPPVRIGGAR